jgi:hypothetical protein
MWRTSPLRRPRMRRTALYRAMRWRPVCGWSCPGFCWLRACRRTRGLWLGLCVCRCWAGRRRFRTCGGLLWAGRGLLWTRGAVSAWPGCRSRCWPGRRLRLPVVLRFWLILRMQCGWQHCAETTEEEAVQQPGRPCFHCHYSLSGIWNVESVIAKHRYCEVVRFVLYSRSLIERLRSEWITTLRPSVPGLYADPGGNAKAGARSDGLGCSILATGSCRSE